MLECLILGDSIARGVANVRQECEQHTQVGITSGRFVLDLLPPNRTSATTAVISLGVNDSDDVPTEANLREVRSRVQAQTVYWLLPGIKDRARDAIRGVAAENGDRIIDTSGQTGPDRLHPTRLGYRAIARQTEGEAGTQVASAEWNRPAERGNFAEQFSPVEPDATPNLPDARPPARDQRQRPHTVAVAGHTRQRLTPEQRRREVQEAAIERRRAKLDRIRRRDPTLLACKGGECDPPRRHAGRDATRQAERQAERQANRQAERRHERQTERQAERRERHPQPAKPVVRADRTRHRSAG